LRQEAGIRCTGQMRMRIKDISGGVYSLTPTRLVEIRKHWGNPEYKDRFVKRAALKKAIKQHGGFVRGFEFERPRQKIGIWSVFVNSYEIGIGCKLFRNSNTKKIKKWALK
jgi:hypothetical protein